jgi:hypothetical protein
MTVETFTPAPIYTVAGIGPYAIGHPYTEGSIRAFVTVGGVEVALDAGSISVAPSAAPVAGDLYLSPVAAATHAGRVLRIERDTVAEQGWLGVQGEREKGLEAQLDRLTYVVQELDAVDARTLRTRDPIASFVPEADRHLLFDGTRIVPGVSKAEVEAVPQYAAAAASSAAGAAASSLAAAQSADTAVRATTADASLRLRTIAELEASTRANAGVGAMWQAGYHLYSEAAPSAVDHTETTAGGVKLYGLPIWSQPDRFNVSDKPWVNISNATVPGPKNHLFVRQETATRTDATTVQLQRVVTTDDGHVNPKALRALTVVTGGGGDQIEWAISGEIENSDNTRVAAEGGTAVSGVALKKAANTGVMFGGHFQVKDETGAATVGGIVGIEANIQANGADTNANRIGFDLIARTYQAGAAGEFTAGLRVRNSQTGSGKWLNAVLIQDGAQATPGAIKATNSPGTSVGYGYLDEGSKAFGVRLAGTYGGAAIQIGAGQFLAFENTNNIKMGWDAGALNLSIFNGANKRFSFEPDPTPRMFINNVQVLQERRTGWTAPIGTASRGSFDPASVTLAQLAERVKAIIDDLTAHGLIGS